MRLPPRQGLSAEASPSSTKRWRTRSTVAVPASTASAMRTSLQAGPSSASSALSRIWACLILRTSALPRASSRSSSSRSAGVSVTRYFLVMAGLLASASPLTKKRSDHHLSPDKALVAALKSGGPNIAKDEALEHVDGYGVGLYITRRDLQRPTGDQKKPWEIGKSF